MPPRKLSDLNIDSIQLYRIFTEMSGFFYRVRKLNLREEKERCLTKTERALKEMAPETAEAEEKAGGLEKELAPKKVERKETANGQDGSTRYSTKFPGIPEE